MPDAGRPGQGGEAGWPAGALFFFLEVTGALFNLSQFPSVRVPAAASAQTDTAREGLGVSVVSAETSTTEQRASRLVDDRARLTSESDIWLVPLIGAVLA